LLNRGTTLSYPEEFKGEEREVTVKGEAYFEVTKSASKKFSVHAGNTKITVLGTSFNVNAPEGAENTEVTVIEGEVEVMDKNNKEEKIRLKKDEQVVFNRKNRNFSKRKVDGSKFKFWFKTRLGKIKKLLKKLGK
jgi:ferric-dicitrate binding protein FerR (iron transport regulator)